MRTQVRRAALTIAMAAALAAPVAPAAPAAAATAPGSIVFVRDHNIWVASGDGASLHQVTRDGTAATPYVTPTQSDTGLIAAGHGDHLVFLGHNGVVRNRLDPDALMNPHLNQLIDGPVREAAISPNGQLVTYTLSTWGCLAGEPCRDHRVTAITRTDRVDLPMTYGQTYFWSASWVDDYRTIQSGIEENQVMFKDIHLAPHRWFIDIDTVHWSEATDLGDLELSPDGRWLAGVRGTGANTRVARYAVRGNARSGPSPAAPILRCQTAPAGGQASSTFAPDSSAVAWQQADGIWVAGADVSTTCPPATLLIPDARTPHWSAAAFDPSRGPAPFPQPDPGPSPQPGPQPAPQPGPQPSPQPSPQPGPPTGPAAYSVLKSPKVLGVARVGRVLRAGAPSITPKPARLSYRWLRNGKPIAGAVGAKQRYRLTAADRGRRISLRVTATGALPAAVVLSAPTAKVRR